MTKKTTARPPITVAEAADILGVTKRTVQYHINHGTLRAERWGKGRTSPWQVNADDVQRLKAEREAEVESSA